MKVFIRDIDSITLIPENDAENAILLHWEKEVMNKLVKYIAMNASSTDNTSLDITFSLNKR